jgi:hypothetical protein
MCELQEGKTLDRTADECQSHVSRKKSDDA